jgi:SAM-dependent methyltransferase
MRGCVDHLTPRYVSGWVFDPAAGDGKMQVRVMFGERVLAEGVADQPRPEVGKLLGTAGDHGFRFAPVDFPSRAAEQVTVQARPSSEAPWRRVRKGRNVAGAPALALAAEPEPEAGAEAGAEAVPETILAGAGGPVAGAATLLAGALRAARPGRRSTRGQYQTFDDARGGSKSADKLAALRLRLLPNAHSEDKPLHGLKVLDIGCNEGFFCGEALRQGASRVVGVDQNKNFLDRARRRFPNARFIRASWWDLPDEKFDVILFLSAIHYEPNQRALLEKLAQHLTPTGVLVLECGVIQGQSKTWHAVKRADDIRRYPTFPMLLRELLRPYAGRLMGASVMQGGDPVPRYVFHCPLRRSMALIVAGAGRTGKSTLAFDLEERNIPLVRTDRLLAGLLGDKRYGFSPVAEVVQALPRTTPPHYGVIGRAVAAKCPKEFVDVLMREAPLEADLFCIEGEILRHAAVMRELTRRLVAANVRPWVVTPGT